MSHWASRSALLVVLTALSQARRGPTHPVTVMFYTASWSEWLCLCQKSTIVRVPVTVDSPEGVFDIEVRVQFFPSPLLYMCEGAPASLLLKSRFRGGSKPLESHAQCIEHQIQLVTTTQQSRINNYSDSVSGDFTQ